MCVNCGNTYIYTLVWKIEGLWRNTAREEKIGRRREGEKEIDRESVFVCVRERKREEERERDSV